MQMLHSSDAHIKVAAAQNIPILIFNEAMETLQTFNKIRTFLLLPEGSCNMRRRSPPWRRRFFLPHTQILRQARSSLGEPMTT